VRERILAEARRQFATLGFGAASLRGVARAVGISGPSVLYHFPSKEALRDAVLGDVLDHWQQHLPAALAAARGKEGRFDATVNALVSFFLADPPRAQLVVRELLDRPDEMRALLTARLAPWLSVVTDTIREGQARGSVRPELDPEAFVVQIVTMAVGTVAVGGTAASMFSMGEAPNERLAAELVRIARTSLFTG
jgi:TetR/AcrR family transcriptional regulator